MLITEEILEATGWGRGMKRKYKALGIEKGIEKGTAAEAARMLRLCVEARFPRLSKLPALSRIRDPRLAEKLLAQVAAAPDERAARGVLEGAPGRNGGR